MLLAALQGDDRVVYMENKALWGLSGEVDEDAQPAMGKARTLRPGRDLTIMSWSAAVDASLAAAQAPTADGIEASAIDLCTQWPWNRDAVLADCTRTVAA